MIIQTSPLIYLGIHAIIVEGPGWSGIGIIQYIWAYGQVHTFEVKGAQWVNPGSFKMCQDETFMVLHFVFIGHLFGKDHKVSLL